MFVSSQLDSRVLTDRVHPKALMLSGLGLGVVASPWRRSCTPDSGYGQIAICLVLLGLGSGTSLVSLTTASLAGVDPHDAGAASGLVNVMQQVGAALGLAVLVTVLDATAGRSQLGAGVGGAGALVHGLDVTFAVAALFALAAMVMVAVLVKLPAPESRTAPVSGEAEGLGLGLELVDGEGFEWADPELVA